MHVEYFEYRMRDTVYVRVKKSKKSTVSDIMNKICI